MLIAITEDGLVLRNLARVAEARSENVLSAKSLTALPEMDAPPSTVIVDLDVKDAVSLAAKVKAQWANALVAGFLSYPNRKLWEAAEAAGFDLVATRGALSAQLQARLEDWKGRSKQRVRVCDAADLAGRLGVIARLSDLPIGPVAVYHVGGEVCAVQDVCPHAGARLSEGELRGAVITCPKHGSQFDVCSGERLRGPADLGITTYRVEIESGQVFLIIRDEG